MSQHVKQRENVKNTYTWATQSAEMKINFSPRPSLAPRLCRTFRGVFQARLCRCGGCYATGLENRCENLLFSHARWSQIKLRFASFRAWVWVSVTISAFVGLYTGIFCCCWCLGLIMNSWQMVGLLSSFLQHRIFIRFRQGIDFCWHFKSVRRKKNFSPFFTRAKKEKNLRDELRTFLIELQQPRWKLKLAENLKHLIYLLFFTELLWTILWGFCGFSDAENFFLFPFAGLSADEHLTKTTCVTLCESKTIELKSTESSGG